MNGTYKAFWITKEKYVEVIDQRDLPFIEKTFLLKTADDAIYAIKDMVIRGAGVIGNIAALGIYLQIKQNNDLEALVKKASEIRLSRPTAVNLMWAVDLMLEELLNTKEDLESAALKKALEICDLDCYESLEISKNGADAFEKILEKKENKVLNVLTHCNAGWLAIADEGSALAPIYELKKRGFNVHVYVDETRPRNQGANLTSWELHKSKIDHTIIPDNTGGYLMQQGLVDVCIVGADRVSANGDVANKIGTYLKALAAKANNIPFYVAIPEGTLDLSCEDGVKEIQIETRSENEVKYIKGLDENNELKEVLIMRKDAKVINYGFDITPSSLISGFIMAKGIIKANELKKFFS